MYDFLMIWGSGALSLCIKEKLSKQKEERALRLCIYLFALSFANIFISHIAAEILNCRIFVVDAAKVAFVPNLGTTVIITMVAAATGIISSLVSLWLDIHIACKEAKISACITRSAKTAPPKIIALLVIVFLTWVSVSLMWVAANFQNIGIDGILFTLNMPMTGTPPNFVNSYLIKVIIPSAVIFLLLLIEAFRPKNYVWYLKILSQKFRLYPIRVRIIPLTIICLIWSAAIFAVANSKLGILRFFKARLEQSAFIENEYVDPNSIKITFPQAQFKRNLIYIMMESAESSLQDESNGGLFSVNYIPEMTKIAKENISFSHTNKIEGAVVAPGCSWTIAGVTAQFAGLPLKLYKCDTIEVGNSMSKYKSFLPGATTLGDILSKHGYKNYCILGADARFAGFDKFVTQHGNSHIYDFYTAVQKGKIKKTPMGWWGCEDYQVYEIAKEELSRISKDKSPFALLISTLDTHAPNGYVCKLCRNVYPEQYANVWNCASRQLDRFIVWLKSQPFYENTTVVICGDHNSMASSFFREFSGSNTIEIKRKVYNAILNAVVKPHQELNRKFVTLDMFPTTLAAMGVEIEGERLGLGTNLFSNKQTLAEKYGYKYLFAELEKRSVFYDEKLLYPKP